MSTNNSIFCLQIRSTPEIDQEIQFFLWEEALTGWEEREYPDKSKDYIIYFDSEKKAEALKESIHTFFPNTNCCILPRLKEDWFFEWRKYFKPMKVGSYFLVVPEWEQDQISLQNKGDLHPIYIFPSMAFGTGNHPTTNLCLQAISRLRSYREISEQSRFLDVGTGSGILGIACARLGLQGFGLDCDPVALRNANYNIALNKLQNLFCIFAGTPESLKSFAGFDLLLINLYYRPLLWMASTFLDLAKFEGWVVLSGILNSQEEQVETTYRNLGLQDAQVVKQEGWSAIFGKNRGQNR